MIVLITLTTAGSDVGPLFDLFSNTDGYSVAFETGVSTSALLAGYTSNLVPDGTTIIRVKSYGACVNYIDITVTGPIAITTTLFGLDTVFEACAGISSILTTTRYVVNAFVNPGDILYNGPGLTNPATWPVASYYGYFVGSTAAWMYVGTDGVVISSGYCTDFDNQYLVRNVNTSQEITVTSNIGMIQIGNYVTLDGPSYSGCWNVLSYSAGSSVTTILAQYTTSTCGSSTTTIPPSYKSVYVNNTSSSGQVVIYSVEVDNIVLIEDTGNFPLTSGQNLVGQAFNSSAGATVYVSISTPTDCPVTVYDTYGGIQCQTSPGGAYFTVDFSGPGSVTISVGEQGTACQ